MYMYIKQRKNIFSEYCFVLMEGLSCTFGQKSNTEQNLLVSCCRYIKNHQQIAECQVEDFNAIIETKYDVYDFRNFLFGFAIAHNQIINPVSKIKPKLLPIFKNRDYFQKYYEINFYFMSILNTYMGCECGQWISFGSAFLLLDSQYGCHLKCYMNIIYILL